MARGAVATVGRGVMGAARRIGALLSRVAGPTLAVLDKAQRTADCAGAVASAVQGDYVGATQGSVECVTRGQNTSRRDGSNPDFGTPSAQCSGNSRLSTLLQHAYDIIDTMMPMIDGIPFIAKTGVSGGRIRRDGRSSRAETQVRNWNNQTSEGRYRSEITHQNAGGEGARQDILDYEQQRAQELRDAGHLDPTRHCRP
ncbi:hypothetical protein [Roseobacter sp. HKCCA0434]|uniref:hypothetical protein n=1 Tax=Roseobacter sp. HKCCA0434 TaxID=3079297 RepID=UPI0029058989|nr:hypothetical protein [Roseobacter sp. HKCCA0434]